MTRTVHIAFLAAAALVALSAPAADAGKPAAPQFYVFSSGSGVEAFGPLTVGVGRTGNLKKAASVTLTPAQIGADTAAAGSDFVATPVVLTFAKNVSQRFVQVSLVDDDVTEAASEAFSLVLSAPSAGVGVAAPGSASILDDDQPGTFAVAAGDEVRVTGTLGGCDDLVARLVIVGGASFAIAGAGGCSSNPVGSGTSGFESPALVVLELEDVTCGRTYSSDGTGIPFDVDHAAVWGSAGSYGVAITDAGGCAFPEVDRQPGSLDQGNLVVSVEITPRIP